LLLVRFRKCSAVVANDTGVPLTLFVGRRDYYIYLGLYIYFVDSVGYLGWIRVDKVDLICIELSIRGTMKFSQECHCGSFVGHLICLIQGGVVGFKF